MRELAQRYNVSLSFVRDLLQRYRATGSVTPRPHGGGNPRAISKQQEQALLILHEEDDDATLDELVDRLFDRYGIVTSRSSVARVFYRLRITRKKRRSAPESKTRNASSASAQSSTGK